jgi:hypothetical protein
MFSLESWVVLLELGIPSWLKNIKLLSKKLLSSVKFTTLVWSSKTGIFHNFDPAKRALAILGNR